MGLKKFTSKIMLSIFMVGLMANSSLAGTGLPQRIHQFKDMKEAVWADRHVTKMAAQNIIKGYTDGCFKPNKPVTQAEAVVLAIKAAGFEKDIETVSGSVYLPFKDGTKLPLWAQKSISLAASKGFIESGSNVSFQPNKPATRQWTAKLIIKAFGLDAEAKAKSDVDLPFKDAASIAPDAVGYIALAFEKNIIAGMPDDSFQPNKPVTRAQIAVMLGLTSLEQEVKSDDKLTGYVKSVSVSEEVYGTEKDSVSDSVYTQGSITINTKKQNTVTIPVSTDVVIYAGETRTTLDKLALGSKVEVIVKNGAAVYIETQSETVRGIIESVTGDTVNLKASDSKIKSYTISDEVKVLINNKAAKLEDLKAGAYAKLTLGAEGKVTEIRAAQLKIKVKKEIIKKNEKTDSKIRVTVDKDIKVVVKVDNGKNHSKR